VSRAKGQRLFLDSGIPLVRDFPNLRLCVSGGADAEDSVEELELKAKLEKELPIEPDLSRWFGVFDAPL